MTLYEINSAILNFDYQIDEETGELLNAEELNVLDLHRQEAIESLLLYCKELDAEAAAIKTEKQNLDERMKAKERKRDGIKRYVQDVLAGEKFETPRCRVQYRKTQSVVTTDAFMDWAKENAPALLRIKQEPDKTAIKEAIKSGAAVYGAELVENTSMTIK